jgi:hypothetical protein
MPNMSLTGMLNEWNPGDTPGDTTRTIQDTAGSWNMTVSGGLVFDSDIPT